MLLLFVYFCLNLTCQFVLCNKIWRCNKICKISSIIYIQLWNHDLTPWTIYIFTHIQVNSNTYYLRPIWSIQIHSPINLWHFNIKILQNDSISIIFCFSIKNFLHELVVSRYFFKIKISIISENFFYMRLNSIKMQCKTQVLHPLI